MHIDGAEPKPQHCPELAAQASRLVREDGWLGLKIECGSLLGVCSHSRARGRVRQLRQRLVAS